MEIVLLISKEPEKWEFFEKNLSNSYKFISLNPEENFDFPNVNINIIATDKIENIEKIRSAEKKKLPIVFFGKPRDFSTEIKARTLGVADFFSIPVDRELLLLRFKNVSEMSRVIKSNADSIRWMQMIRNEMINVQENMAQTIAQTVESRDENTGGHIIRTATFMSLLAEEFVVKGRITKEQLDLIVRAAPLHDIGKIGVSDSILLKPGPLTNEERKEMMSHSERGAILIKKMQKKFDSHTYLQYAYDIALNHHERFDGKGYPHGKKGEEIPFWARLMSVVDVYDALVSDRVYRKGMEIDKACEIVFSGAGTQFDPEVLQAFDDCKEYLI
ncbi:MAG: HD domain-containing protein [Candidatus Fibromonas sp.]|jgi:putative two-component system response regulator|nr:HD domain-containing protein [Candidatus Fibromonas sp.]